MFQHEGLSSSPNQISERQWGRNVTCAESNSSLEFAARHVTKRTGQYRQSKSSCILWPWIIRINSTPLVTLSNFSLLKRTQAYAIALCGCHESSSSNSYYLWQRAVFFGGPTSRSANRLLRFIEPAGVFHFTDIVKTYLTPVTRSDLEFNFYGALLPLPLWHASHSPQSDHPKVGHRSPLRSSKQAISV